MEEAAGSSPAAATLVETTSPPSVCAQQSPAREVPLHTETVASGAEGESSVTSDCAVSASEVPQAMTANAPPTASARTEAEHDSEGSDDDDEEQPVSTRARREMVCCICSEPALYTCPGCGRHTCSVTCVRVHKTDHGCSGERSVAVPMTLQEFTDAQLQRDYHFLEDCRRVVHNAQRSFPHTWRYSFKALPPPLHALREAAKRRGVLCQITSEGMRKRDANTSRFDRKTNTLVWRCEFTFHPPAPQPAFTVATNWASERHRLGDVMRYCWSTNPPLPCFHINCTYNRASKYLGGTGSGSGAANDGPTGDGQPDQGVSADSAPKDQQETVAAPPSPEPPGEALEKAATSEQMEEEADDSALSSTVHSDSDVNSEDDGGAAVSDAEELESVEGPAHEAVTDAPENHTPRSGAPAAANLVILTDEAPLDGVPHHHTDARAGGNGLPSSGGGVSTGEEAQSCTADIHVSPLNAEEEANEALVRGFLATADNTVILSKAERLGSTAKYFVLDQTATLNENLRLLFFVSEYPCFDVINAADVAQYELVTEADKEAIRESFRAKERVPGEGGAGRGAPHRPKRSELDAEEAERLQKVPCRMNLAGTCRLAEECPYWHCTLDEVPACRSMVRFGKCDKGARCSFRHDQDAVRAATAGQKRRRPDERGRRGGGGGGGYSATPRAGRPRFSPPQPQHQHPYVARYPRPPSPSP